MDSWMIFSNPIPKHLQYFFLREKKFDKGQENCHLDEREGQSHKSIFSI